MSQYLSTVFFLDLNFSYKIFLFSERMTENLFRNDFKYYKQKVPAPSLDAVIDSRKPGHLAEHFREIHVENKDGDIPKNMNLKTKWRMFASKRNPGK